MSITAGMSPYAGGPTAEIDNAWHDLLGNISLRVSRSELNMNGNHKSSIELPGNGGYLVWLGAFHQLHCLVNKSLLCLIDLALTMWAPRKWSDSSIIRTTTIRIRPTLRQETRKYILVWKIVWILLYSTCLANFGMVRSLHRDASTSRYVQPWYIFHNFRMDTFRPKTRFGCSTLWKAMRWLGTFHGGHIASDCKLRGGWCT